MSEFTLNINGAQLSVNAPADESLLSVLRNRLNLTGTKYGCGEGPMRSLHRSAGWASNPLLLVTVGSAANVKIITIEGLERNGKLSPVQQAFLDEGAFQCGYCTSGMILNATSLLNEKRNPTEEQIVEAMNGNVCRCGTYPRILAAVRRAAQQPEQGASR